MGVPQRRAQLCVTLSHSQSGEAAESGAERLPNSVSTHGLRPLNITANADNASRKNDSGRHYTNAPNSGSVPAQGLRRRQNVRNFQGGEPDHAKRLG